MRSFFETLYQGLKSGYIAIWDLPTKKTEFYQVGDWNTLIADVDQRLKKNRDIYFGVCPYAYQMQDGRGKEKDVGAITTLFADIDIAAGVHLSGRKYPETVEKALELLKPFPEPSIFVHSGGGLHAYWLLENPLIIQNDEDRAAAKKLLSGFQNAIIKEFATHGYGMDNTADLARVLRVPGTLNFKNPDEPKEVRIING